MTPEHATCRHCAAALTRLPNGHWVDVFGWYRCMKDVNHEPMPAGLDGAA